MPIDFFNILSDDDWTPLTMDQSDPANLWHDGGSLADAPVDMNATFDGNVWTSAAMDPEFRLEGIRLAPKFVFPARSHNQHKLIVVLGGECEIEYRDDSGNDVTERVSGPGGFFVVGEGIRHTMTAGPDGVRYTEQWDYHPPAKVETTWYDVGWVRR